MRTLLIVACAFMIQFTLGAQANDSILYKLTFYFEDAIGNRDTIYVGGSPYVNGDEVIPAFGEINLVDVPFDSVFEVRVTNATNLYTFGDSVKYIGKKRILQYALTDFGSFPCDWNGGIGEFAFVANVANPPLTISWDSQKFRQEENIGCLMSTNIVNSFVGVIIDGWWNGDFPPGIDYACVGSTSSISFYPFNTPSGLDLDWLTYARLPVEGSSFAKDTLPAYYLNFVYSGGPPPPCNTIVDTDEQAPPDSERIFPNPTSGLLRFSVSRPGAFFTVFTTDGRKILTIPIDAEGQVNVRNLSPGLYFYRIAEPGEQGRSGRFVRR